MTLKFQLKDIHSLIFEYLCVPCINNNYLCNCPYKTFL
jgi:hypothetical protein